MLPKDPEKLKVKPDSSSLSSGESSQIIGLLIVIQCLLGAACIVGGALIAAKTHPYGPVYVIGGLVSGMFMFTLAVVTAACKKYLNSK